MSELGGGGGGSGSRAEEVGVLFREREGERGDIYSADILISQKTIDFTNDVQGDSAGPGPGRLLFLLFHCLPTSEVLIGMM